MWVSHGTHMNWSCFLQQTSVIYIYYNMSHFSCRCYAYARERERKRFSLVCWRKHDQFICVPWLTHMTHSYVCRDSLTWLRVKRERERERIVFLKEIMKGTWPIHVCAVMHTHDPFTCVLCSLIRRVEGVMTHSCVGSWPIHVCAVLTHTPHR